MDRKLTLLDKLPPWEWPPDAERTIVAVLGNRSRPAAERIRAAHLAGENPNITDSQTAKLTAIVADSADPDEVRIAAAIALGPGLETQDMEDGDSELDEPPLTDLVFARAKRTLHRVYDDPASSKLLRRRVLEAAVRAPEDWQR